MKEASANLQESEAMGVSINGVPLIFPQIF